MNVLRQWEAMNETDQIKLLRFGNVAAAVAFPALAAERYSGGYLVYYVQWYIDKCIRFRD